MKTTIIFSVMMLPTLLWGQIVNHFENLDSKWNVAKTHPSGTQQNPNFATTTTTIFGFQGDTLINSEQWLKLYSTNDSLFQSNLIYRGLTRKANHLILYRDTLNQIDTLYNFDLSLGDSVLFNLYGMHPEWLKVINVDSIAMNGNFYKRLKFAEPDMIAFDKLNEVWIEGIGSIHGPLFPNFPVKFSQEMPDSMLLTCTFSNNQEVWQHAAYNNCYVSIVLGIDKHELYSFKIYPNPFSDQIHFENKIAEVLYMTILDNIGQVVKQVQITGKNATIDLSQLNDGIYFLRWSDPQNIRTVKMIKTH